MKRSYAIAVSTTLALATSSSASAQERVEPTPAQRQYNDRGVQLMIDGDYEEAAANFQSSLAIGPTNIAWLNLGRAHFKLNRCRESRTAYDRVPDAPPVAVPSAAEVASVLQRFEGEWSSACTARLRLDCPADRSLVRIDDGEPFACVGDPIPVTPGEHTVAVVPDGPEWTVKTAAGEEASVAVRAPQPEEPERQTAEEQAGGEDATVVVESRDVEPSGDGGGIGRPIGLGVASLGGAMLVAGLVLDRVWVAPAFDDYEAAPTPGEWSSTREIVRNRQRANTVVLIAGAGLAAVGMTVFFASGRSGESVALRVTPASLAFGGRW